MKIDPNDAPFSSLFSPAEVICRTAEKDRNKVLLDLLNLLAFRRGIGDVDEAYRAVLAREDDMPTIVAAGMAMPHARLETIKDLVVGVATSPDGIVYDPRRPDALVKLIILTLTPMHSPFAYLQAIGSVARICLAPSTPDVIAALPTPEQVWSFFDKGETLGSG